MTCVLVVVAKNSNNATVSKNTKMNKSAVHPDELFMQRCIALAYNGLRYTKSNPMVGAVIVHNGRIIGEGYHQKYGAAHAEVNAIESINPLDKAFLTQSTIYVTLEPCCHTGKTPPCVHRILQEKIPRVVIGCKDPNPVVGGKSIEILKQNGVEVVENILADLCEELITKFKANLQGIPYIILKWAQSQDFYLSKLGKQIKLSNDTVDVLVHQWRSEAEGILVGRNTAIIDNPSLTTRHVSGESPIRILMDSKLSVDQSLNLISDPKPTIIINKVQEKSIENKHYIQVEDTHDLLHVLKIIYSQGITSLLVEGGGEILKSFINSGLWHEARIITSTKKLQDGVPAPMLQGQLMNKMIIQDNEIIIVHNKYFPT